MDNSQRKLKKEGIRRLESWAALVKISEFLKEEGIFYRTNMFTTLLKMMEHEGNHVFKKGRKKTWKNWIKLP